MTLIGKVAFMAGTTRGAGRRIAVELGAAGAKVYVTGRTTRLQQSDVWPRLGDARGSRAAHRA